MKKVLTGFSNNITKHKKKLKWWSESFRKYSDGDIVLIAANTTNEDINTLNDLNIKYYLVSEEDTWRINHKRLIHTKKFLESSDYELFLITDVFDVVFQSDPFKKLDTNNYDVFTSKEGILVNEEPWNADVIKKTFPNEVQSCMKTEIVCSGIIAGKREALIELYDKMYIMCENSEDGHNIKDQAALIILVKNNSINKLKNFNLDDGWAIHCQSAGPTQFFDSWGLKKSLIKKGYGVPIMCNDDCVYTQSKIKFDMVHQFNRIKEWEERLTKNYE